jgi:hypothetical protein
MEKLGVVYFVFFAVLDLLVVVFCLEVFLNSVYFYIKKASDKIYYGVGIGRRDSRYFLVTRGGIIDSYGFYSAKETIGTD